MEKLFAYGTLLDPQIQMILLGREVSVEPHTLKNYTTVAASDGYLSLISMEGETVNGGILELTEDELFICDMWEEFPLYDRKKDGENGIWIYCRDTNEEQHAASATQITDAELYSITEAFKKEIDVNNPIYDLYILLPCYGDLNLHNDWISNTQRKFTEIFSGVLKSEYLHNEYIAIRPYGNFTAKADNGSSLRCEVFLISDKRIESRILLFSIPVCKENPVDITATIYYGIGYYKSIYEYTTNKIGLKIAGKPIFTFFCKNELNKDRLTYLLNAETYNNTIDIIGDLTVAANKNIAQYSSAQIYASPICVVEIPQKFSLSYDERVERQILTLFIVSLLGLHEASLFLFRRELLNPLKKIDLNNLVMKNFEISAYWNIEYFYYPTARYLANALAEISGENRLKETVYECKEILERFLLNEQEKNKNKSDERLNTFMTILALVALYDGLASFTEQLQQGFNYISIITHTVYGALCIIAFISYRRFTK